MKTIEAKVLLKNGQWDMNRDRAYLWFEELEGNPDIYTIHTTEDKEYVLEYCQTNYDILPDDAEDYDIIYTMQDGRKIKTRIDSFDPAAGPYMAIGDNINGYKLNRIFAKEGIPGTLFHLTKIES